MTTSAFVRSHPECLRLYAVTDTAWLDGRTLAQCALQAVRGGATFLQLRTKGASTEQLVAQYESIADALRREGLCVPFVVNDDVQAALACNAHGVHVGQSDAACAQARALLGSEKIVGVSVQTVQQALEAQAAGADYLGVGALFVTGTKPDAQRVSLETFKEICQAVSIPVVGIGGLDARTIPGLVGTGAVGAAVVSAIFAAEDIEEAAADLRRELDYVL